MKNIINQSQVQSERAAQHTERLCYNDTEFSHEMGNSPKTSESTIVLKNLPRSTAKVNLITGDCKLRTKTMLKISKMSNAESNVVKKQTHASRNTTKSSVGGTQQELPYSKVVQKPIQMSTASP